MKCGAASLGRLGSVVEAVFGIVVVVGVVVVVLVLRGAKKSGRTLHGDCK